MFEVALPKVKAHSKSMTGYWIFATEGLVAIAIGFGLTALGLGSAAWILGGIGAGALVFYGYRMSGNSPIQPNRKARKVGQIIIGLTIGLSLQQSNLTLFSSHWLFLLGLPLFLLVSGGLIGGIYAQIEKTDLLTAMLATSPGNIGVMASIAADYSKSASLVSLVQLMRFTSVILVMPMIVNGAIAHSTHSSFKELLSPLLTLQISQLPLSCLILAVASLAVYLGGKLKIPVAGFFCAIAIGLAFDILPLLFPPLASFDFRLPPLFSVVGQVLLGITIGEYWGINPRLKGSTVANAVIPVSLMFGVTFLAAAGARLLTSWDWLTCLLIAAPGGSPEMIWIALTLNHNVEIVTAGHLIRLLIINLSLPGLISVACYLDRESESI